LLGSRGESNIYGVSGLHLARLGAHKPQTPTGIVRTTRAPDGAEWEISASRLVSPKWRPGGLNPSLMGVRAGPFLDEGPLSAIFNAMLVPMARYLFELPAAIAKGRSSKVIWIEAKSHYPVHESYYWRTSVDHVVAAIDDIADGLEAGETAPRSIRASYHGTTQNWTGD
jgi:hypothetical protein